MYESNAQAVSTQLTATSTEVFNAATIQQILSLVTSSTDTTVVVDTAIASNNATISGGAGVEVLFVNTAANAVTNVTVTGDTPVVFFQGAGGVNAVIGTATANTAEAGSSMATVAGVNVERVIVGTAGADTITIVDGKNTQVIVGDKDVVVAGTGHLVVNATQGSSKVTGNNETVIVTAGVEDDFTISTSNGVSKITNTKTNVSVEFTDVDFVQLNGTDALIFADDAGQAVVAHIYQALLGRTADAGGLDFWFDRADDGVSLTSIANGFMNATEYTGKTQTNAQFIDALYDGLLARDGDAAGSAFWIAQLSGGMSRADVAVEFVEAVMSGVEAQIVGSVTIVDPIG
jgi:hypothetical protein